MLHPIFSPRKRRKDEGFLSVYGCLCGDWKFENGDFRFEVASQFSYQAMLRSILKFQISIFQFAILKHWSFF
jgi:hypothetical protein